MENGISDHHWIQGQPTQSLTVSTHFGQSTMYDPPNRLQHFLCAWHVCFGDYSSKTEKS